MAKLPECSSRKYWTDCGYEYDCDAYEVPSCEECLCTYRTLGGLVRPDTGKVVHPLIARILYGVRSVDLPDTPGHDTL